MVFETRAFVILIAFLIDLLLGDPESRYHPVRFIGKSISLAERLTFFKNNQRLGGVVFIIGLILFWGSVGFFIQLVGWPFFDVLLLYSMISCGELCKRVERIAAYIEAGDLYGAKGVLHFLVTRNVDFLSEEEVVRGSVETLSENISDGFIAPVLFYFLGGPVALLVYKVCETADSMVGYKNERYIKFGWAAAKLDDIFNFVPARISLVLFSISSFLMGYGALNSIRWGIKYGKLFDSPNAGYPQAALAGALGIRVGGCSYYNGKKTAKPIVGYDLRKVDHHVLYDAVSIARVSCFVLVFLLLCAG